MSDDAFDRELAGIRDDWRARAMLVARVRRQSLLILTLTERIRDQDRENARLRDLLTIALDSAARRLRMVRALSGDDRPTRMLDEGVVLGAMERLGLLPAGEPHPDAHVAAGRVVRVDGPDEDLARRQAMLELLVRMDAEDPPAHEGGIAELLADLDSEHGPISNEVREAVEREWDEALRGARESRTEAPRSGSSEAGRRAEPERDEPDERNV